MENFPLATVVLVPICLPVYFIFYIPIMPRNLLKCMIYMADKVLNSPLSSAEINIISIRCVKWRKRKATMK